MRYPRERPRFARRELAALAGRPHLLHGRVAGEVNAFVETARGRGAEVLHEPRLWPEYHASYYGGFVRDPDGNNVEAVHHGSRASRNDLSGR
jgi:hypothetical protein